MAYEMDVPLTNRRGTTSHHTLRVYIELLSGGYFLFILYYWRASSQTNNLSNEAKVCFADPLLHTIALDHAPGLDIVEVKYQRQINLRSAVAVAKAHPGRPAVTATAMT